MLYWLLGTILPIYVGSNKSAKNDDDSDSYAREKINKFENIILRIWEWIANVIFCICSKGCLCTAT